MTNIPDWNIFFNKKLNTGKVNGSVSETVPVSDTYGYEIPWMLL